MKCDERQRLGPVLLCALLCGATAQGLSQASDVAPRGKETPEPAVRNAPAAKLAGLLRDLDTLKREERIGRWKAIFELSETSQEAACRLRQMTMPEAGGVDRYQRFVAASNVAGFGMPTRIGPNQVDFLPLGRYVEIQRGIRVPNHRGRRLRVDPAIAKLPVTVVPNRGDDLYFQEIIWTIINKYNLDFRTEADGTFVLLPGQPAV